MARSTVRYGIGNRGGARPGAGRPKGTTDKTKKRLLERTSRGGKTPLDQMIAAYRYFDDLATKARRAKDVESAVKYYVLAAEKARDAAPFMHHRLATTVVKGDPNQPLHHTVEVEFI